MVGRSDAESHEPRAQAGSLISCMATSTRKPLVYLAAASITFFACSDDRVIDDDIGGDDAGDESGNLDDGSETDAATDQPGGPPEFIAPLGEGTVVDLSVETCVEVEIVVEDPDGDEVTISTEAAIEGATMAADSSGTSVWTWCPTERQVEAGELTVTFLADDGTHAPVLKELLFQIRR